MKWDTIDIALAKNTRARRKYASYARRLQARMRCINPIEPMYRDRSRMLLDSAALPVKHQATFRASALILTDLALQGWRIRVTRDNRVTVAAPAVATSRETCTRYHSGTGTPEARCATGTTLGQGVHPSNGAQKSF